MEEEIIRPIVEEFSSAFKADGGDLVLTSCDPKSATVQIRIGPKTCRECIMAPEDIKEILTSSIESQLGRPINVKVEVVDIA